MYSRITGTGRYLPERVVTNHDLEQMVDTTDEWIRTRTGIERRHVAAEGETTLDLSEHAARRAMEAAGVGPEDIDFLVIGTLTPDLVFPNVACLLQERMGIRDCPAFSLETACSGFVYGLSIADKYITTGDAECALVIGAETLTRVLDWEDRATCVLFGDGAGAAILQPSEAPGVLSTHLGADGQHSSLLYHPYGPSKPQYPNDMERPFIQMRGNELFKIAVKTLERCVQDALKANEIDPSEIDWFVPHQANIRIIQAMAKRLGMPMDKVILTLKEHGNTSAASVPMALDVAVRDGRIKEGDLLLLETFGGGITWGSALIRY